MSQPRERVVEAGRTIVWAKYNAEDEWVRDDRWYVRSIELGTNDRASSAVIEFDRARLLKDPSIGEPEIFADSRFILGHQEPDQVNADALFDGIPAGLLRRDQGAPGAQATIGRLELKSTVDLYRADKDSQIDGAWWPRIPDPSQSLGRYIKDQAARVVFNPDNLPNRSINRDVNSDHFATNEDYDTYYFTDADGYDYVEGARWRAEYWSYAQAIAYLLCLHAKDDGQQGSVSLRTIPIDYGLRSEETDSLWSVIFPVLDIGPLDDRGVGVENFDPSTTILLTQKVPGIDVTDMDVLTAIGTLLRRCGMGWFISAKQPTSNADNPPDPMIHQFRVFSPGGSLVPGGVGQPYVPKLEPYNISARISGTLREASEILANNNLSDVDVRYDFNGIVSAPMVKPAPKRYEITVELRPFWRPIEGGANGEGTAFIDNIDPTAVFTDSQYASNQLLQNVAIGELDGALLLNRGVPSLFMGSAAGGDVVRRMDWMSKALVASGEYGVQYFDVLRKWGLPTDPSYAGGEYDRDSAAYVPQSWWSYKPFNFANTSGVIYRPITDAELWPTRRRPFLPLLVKDASGANIPPVVELSVDSGTTWFEWSSVRFDQKDSFLHLLWENPIDCKNPRAENKETFYFALAYLKGTARVRVTCSIEGSDEVIPDAPTLTAIGGPRYKIVPAYDIRSESVISKHIEQYADDPFNLSDQSDAEVSPDSPLPAKRKFFLFETKDISNVARGRGNRTITRAAIPIVNGSISIPWIELDVEPGSVVPRVEDNRVGDVVSGLTEVPRNLDFSFEIRQGVPLAPNVAGIAYRFGQGTLRTEIVLTDWRAIGGLA